MANVDEYKTEIRRTFGLVKPTEAAAFFYPTLWEINPSTKVLFKNTDMEKQGEKLMKTLGVAVAMLNSMDKLVPILQQLGRKHVSYGVTAEMYPSVAEALLMTLDKGLGAECTPETKEAWGWALGVIAGVCIDAAKELDPTYGDSKEESDEKPEKKEEGKEDTETAKGGDAEPATQETNEEGPDKTAEETVEAVQETTGA